MARHKKSFSEKDLERLPGYIGRRIFHNESDGFSVFTMTAKQTAVAEQFTVSVKTTSTFENGDAVVAFGEWSTYKGKQSFKAIALIHDVPKSAGGIENWLITKAPKGVGKATIKKLIAHFGDDINDALNDTETLVNAGAGLGINRKKCEAIAQVWRENALSAEIHNFLSPFGIKTDVITRIIDTYGGSALSVAQEDPYRLAREIQGISFEKADEIGQALGIEKTSPARIEAGIIHAMHEATQKNGHTGLPRPLLVRRSRRLLQIDVKLIAKGIAELEITGDLAFFKQTGLIQPAKLAIAERDIAERIKQLQKSCETAVSEEQALVAVDQAQRELGIKLDPGQRLAAIGALVHPLAIITGGPGTGKTTTQRIIVQALAALNFSVATCGPTGLSAKRLSEATGTKAETMHRKLKYGLQGFFINRDNPLAADYVIGDEFSMVDVILGAALFNGVADGASMIVVGDVDQLRSVGPGRVLADLIESEIIPVFRLEVVHRQATGSSIVDVAAKMRNGDVPELEEGLTERGVCHIPAKTGQEAMNIVANLIAREFPLMGADPLTDIQILTPVRDRGLGVTQLNNAAKYVLNPALEDSEDTVQSAGRFYSVDDRVIQTVNYAAKNVFNGEVGRVSRVRARDKSDKTSKLTAEVTFPDRAIVFENEEVSELEHAWSLTNHKSQGSEYDIVVLICLGEHEFMLDRSSLYTALTRAKALCVVVGSLQTFAKAIRKGRTNERGTTLLYRLRPDWETNYEGIFITKHVASTSGASLSGAFSLQRPAQQRQAP